MRRTDGSDGGSAFPHHWQDSVQGMSLRDYFAGQALPAVIERCHSDHGAIEAVKRDGTPVKFFAAVAYQMADAMLAERAR